MTRTDTDQLIKEIDEVLRQTMESYGDRDKARNATSGA